MPIPYLADSTLNVAQTNAINFTPLNALIVGNSRTRQREIHFDARALPIPRIGNRQQTHAPYQSPQL